MHRQSAKPNPCARASLSTPLHHLLDTKSPPSVRNSDVACIQQDAIRMRLPKTALQPSPHLQRHPPSSTPANQRGYRSAPKTVLPSLPPPLFPPPASSSTFHLPCDCLLLNSNLHPRSTSSLLAATPSPIPTPPLLSLPSPSVVFSRSSAGPRTLQQDPFIPRTLRT